MNITKYCAIGISGFAALSSFEAHAQERPNCDAVLEKASREYQLRMSDEQLTRFSSYWNDSARSGNFKVPIKKVVVEGGFSNSNSSGGEEFSQYRQRLFERSNTVYGPAIEAWLNCQSSGLGIQVVPTVVDNLPGGRPSHERIFFKATIGTGYRSFITSISRRETVDCYLDGNKLSDADFPIEMSGDSAKNFECIRTELSDPFELEYIRFNTESGLADQTHYIPTIWFPAVEENQSNQIEPFYENLTSFDGARFTPADPYRDRIFRVTYDLRVTGIPNAASATASIDFNATERRSETRNSGPNNEFDVEMQEDFLLRAGEPGLISWGMTQSSNLSRKLSTSVRIGVLAERLPGSLRGYVSSSDSDNLFTRAFADSRIPDDN